MMRLTLALAGGLLLALAFVGYRNRHRFRYRPTGLDSVAYRKLAESPGFVADEVEVAPGVVLRGLVRKAVAPQVPWLWFVPGNGGDVLLGAQALLGRLAGDDGYGLAVWAHRGFDGSGGTPSATALAADCEHLCAHLQNRYDVQPTRLHLVSFSLGTALALQLAAHLQARGTPPASVLLLSPYDRLQVTRDVWWAPWTFADVYDAMPYADASSVRALLMHGSDDDAVPVQASRRLAQAMGPRATLLELAGRGHADWLADDAVLAKARAFLAADSHDEVQPPLHKR